MKTAIKQAILVQSTALINEFGPRLVIEAMADALYAHSVTSGQKHDHRTAGQLAAVVSAMQFTAEKLDQ